MGIRVGDQYLTAVLTASAIMELKLRRGDQVLALVKATQVALGRERSLDRTASKRVRARRGTRQAAD